MRATILVPFDDLGRLQETLCTAMKVAERLAAELILLRVNLPQSKTGSQPREEHLYSELKALQAQCVGCPVPLRIEAMAGPVEQAIIRFAAQQDVDLILSRDVGQLLTKNEPARVVQNAPPSSRRWMENVLSASHA